jgi:hypothetical protein
MTYCLPVLPGNPLEELLQANFLVDNYWFNYSVFTQLL